jgi:hypothetical protein
MNPAWLIAAIGLAAAAAWIGGPAWRSYRAERWQAANSDKYLAWRGRAERSPGPPASVPWRVWLAVSLAVVAVGCAVIGLSGG